MRAIRPAFAASCGRNRATMWIAILRVAIAVCLAILPVAARAQAPAQQPAPDDPPLPLIGNMQLPSPTALLDEARDWIVLKDNRVIVAQPVYPRPNTLEKLEEKLEALRRLPAPRDPAERRKHQDELDTLQYIIVQLPGEELLYRLNRDHVALIVHYEDHLLQQAANLTGARRFREAFELLFVLARRAPDWPGLAEGQQRLLFAQAQDHYESGRYERALAVLEDLHSRNPEYAGLSATLGRVADRLITDAAGREDFRRARHFLGRLANLDPEHEVAIRWRTDFENRARTLRDKALAASAAGRHDEAAAEIARAANIWPALPNLRTEFDRLKRRHQTLRVGVLRFVDSPAGGAPPEVPRPNVLAGDAERRHARLTVTRLFEPGRADRITRFDTDHCDLWEPTDLGRRVEFFLRAGRPAWDPQPALSAADVVRELHARLNERSPRFDERLASYIESAAVNGPWQFEIRFRRVPLRPEPLLSIAVPVQEEGALAAAGPFRVHDRGEGVLVYRRARPEPDDLRLYHLAEVIERRFDSPDDAMRALLRGEIDALPSVEPRDVQALRRNDEYLIRQSALPVTHVVQFHPASAALKNGELRRAMEFSIDREQILRETVLKGASAEFGRVVSGPFPTRSFAYDSTVIPRKPNRVLAYTLAFSVRKRISGGLPKLRMVCVPDPLARAAAARLIEQWKQAGIEVELLPAETASLDDGWDLVYRTVRMADPLTELWPFLTLDAQARVDGLALLPDWLRQQVIDLEYAADWKTAEERLKRLHRELAAETAFLPLWEVEEFQALRRTVRLPQGATDRPVTLYDGIEQWSVDPVYPRESP